MICVVDESGAKGYADNQEQKLGEFGNVAGIFFLEKDYILIKKQADTIYQKYKNSKTKLHITELTPDLKKKLREEIFNLIINNEISWVFQAIYTNGFYNESYAKNKEKYRETKFHYSLHTELLKTILIQGISLLNFLNLENLKFIIDRVDTDTINKLNKTKNEFILDSFNEITPGELSETGSKKIYDKKNKKLKKVEYTIKITGDLDDIKYLRKLNIDIINDNNNQYNSLTLIADVLSNFVYMNLNKKIKNKIGIELNSRDHFKESILYKKLLFSEGVDLDLSFPYTEL